MKEASNKQLKPKTNPPTTYLSAITQPEKVRSLSIRTPKKRVQADALNSASLRAAVYKQLRFIKETKVTRLIQ